MKYKALINGNKIETDDWVKIISPLDNKVVGQVPALKVKDINIAYESAFKAQKNWENLSLKQRIEFIKTFRNLILKNKNELAHIMTLEIAKTKKESLIEIMRSVKYIDYTIEEAIRIHPETFTGNDNSKIGIFQRVAKGVVLAISPFNYPINLAISKIIPALIMGNTVVFKPATQGSLTGLYLANLLNETKIPNGVFNAVSGKGREIGDILVENDYINVISFTGSVEVGKNLANKSKKVDLILELGGKDPAIITNSADLKDCAQQIVKGAFSYNGQRCTAIKRVLVLENNADQLVDLITSEVKKLKIGNPEQDCDITAMIDSQSVDFVESLIDDALSKGAKLITGNKRENNTLWPTLIDNVTTKMKLCWDEPFGPVLPIIRVKTIDEIIKLVNESAFGLQASIFTNDINEAFNIAKQLDVGTVNINGQPSRGPDYFPFTGVKDSGLGVQGIKESLLSMSRPKGLVLNIKK